MAATKSALIVVDMQEDFCPPNGSLAVPGGRDLAPAINNLLGRSGFALKVATQDWHPPDSRTFVSQHEGAKAFSSTYTGTNPSDASHQETWPLWPDHCVQGTGGAAIIPEIDVSAIDALVRKGQNREAEAFSGFGDIFGRRGDAAGASLDLRTTLIDAGITTVYVVGLATNHCVKATALDARRDGFDTAVVWDCTRCVDPAKRSIAKDELEKAGVRIIDSNAEELKILA